MAQPARKTKVAPKPPAGAAPRGRPTPERIAAIGAAIRQAALELFVDVGFEAASMDAIAARAGVSKGTLYSRYDSKEPLFRAILDEQNDAWSKRAGAHDHLLPDELGPRLRYHARILLDVFGWPEYRRISRLLDTAAPSMPELARHWEEIGTKRYLRFLASEIAKTAATVSEADCQLYASVFLFALTGRFRADSELGPDNREAIIAYTDGVIAMIELAAADARRPNR